MVKFLKQSVVLSTVPEHTIVAVPEIYSALFQVRIVFGLFQSCKAESTSLAPGMRVFLFWETHCTHRVSTPKQNVTLGTCDLYLLVC